MRLLWWVPTVVLIGAATIFLSEQRALDPVQNLSLTITAPAAGSLHDAARPVDDFIRGITDRGDIADENRDLKEQVEQLQQALAQQQDAQQRVRELEDALNVRQGRPEDQLLAANVIAEDTSALKRMIAIDRGTGDGLDEGMVVLSRSGSLVGTVSRSYEDFAWVRLITDPDSTINAQVVPAPSPQPSPSQSEATVTPPPASASPSGTTGPTPAPTPAPSPTPAPRADESSTLRGVVEGDLRHELWLDLLPPDLNVPEGSLVSTSGLGGNYPRALLIGSVESVEQRPQSPFTKATVEPAATLSGLDTVLVLLSFTPARLTEQ